MDPYATVDQVWAGGLLFARLGAIVMLLPGIGEGFVPARIRLALALLLAMALHPLVAHTLPALPATLGGTVGWVLREVAVGLAIGAILRIFTTALMTAGEIVSMQTTLGFAQTANPMQASPGSTLSSFLTLLGICLIFATNTHHMFIGAILGSYELIGLSKPIIAADFSQLAVRTLSQSFLLGVQLAAPVMVFALVFNLASGLVARVMPSFQVYFAASPLSVILGLSIFALSLGVIGTVFIERYRAMMGVFAGGALG